MELSPYGELNLRLYASILTPTVRCYSASNWLHGPGTANRSVWPCSDNTALGNENATLYTRQRPSIGEIVDIWSLLKFLALLSLGPPVGELFPGDFERIVVRIAFLPTRCFLVPLLRRSLAIEDVAELAP